jgi:hypothetical protein
MEEDLDGLEAVSEEDEAQPDDIGLSNSEIEFANDGDDSGEAGEHGEAAATKRVDHDAEVLASYNGDLERIQALAGKVVDYAKGAFAPFDDAVREPAEFLAPTELLTGMRREVDPNLTMDQVNSVLMKHATGSKESWLDVMQMDARGGGKVAAFRWKHPKGSPEDYFETCKQEAKRLNKERLARAKQRRKQPAEDPKSPADTTKEETAMDKIARMRSAKSPPKKTKVSKKVREPLPTTGVPDLPRTLKEKASDVELCMTMRKWYRAKLKMKTKAPIDIITFMKEMPNLCTGYDVQEISRVVNTNRNSSTGTALEKGKVAKITMMVLEPEVYDNIIEQIMEKIAAACAEKPFRRYSYTFDAFRRLRFFPAGLNNDDRLAITNRVFETIVPGVRDDKVKVAHLISTLKGGTKTRVIRFISTEYSESEASARKKQKTAKTAKTTPDADAAIADDEDNNDF